MPTGKNSIKTVQITQSLEAANIIINSKKLHRAVAAAVNGTG